DAAGERVGMATVGAERVVALFHGAAETCRDRLLPERQVARALHEVLQEQVVGALLSLPYAELRVIKLQPHLLADVVVREAAVRCRRTGSRTGRFHRHSGDL